MTATNHALTGALIGLTIHQPLLAIPVAVLSHFVLDALPHFGWKQPQEQLMKSNVFRNYLVVEALLCFLIVIGLSIARPDYWWLAVLCAFFAAAPDLLSFNRFWSHRTGKAWEAGLYSRFAHGIQWFERPIGAVVEVAWCVGALMLITQLVF